VPLISEEQNYNRTLSEYFVKRGHCRSPFSHSATTGKAVEFLLLPEEAWKLAAQRRAIPCHSGTIELGSSWRSLGS